MRLLKTLEGKLKKAAMIYLEEGKPDWDVPYTLACVYWMRKLLKTERGDERILLTTMYLHDIGYPSMKQGYNFEELMKAKERHGELGAKRARKILINLNYTTEEIKGITYLIKQHNIKNNLESLNRVLVMEADSLAAIDWHRVKPNFDRKNCLKYLDFFKKMQAPNFQTKTGKYYLAQLLKKADKYLD